MEYKEQIPVDLVSGFKGAGKTTLIRAMADTLWPGERVVFLQNELGVQNLSELEENEACAVVQLAGGCLCCTASSQLEQSLHELKENYHPDRIVLELAETARLTDVKANFVQLADFQTEHIIYVLNACDFLKKWRMSERFLAQQLMETPVLYLNRAKKAGEPCLEAIHTAVKENNPKCVTYGDGVALDVLYHNSRVFQRIAISGRKGVRGGVITPLIKI